MFRAIKGTYVYVCDPKLKRYFSKHISNFRKALPIPFKEESKVIPFVNAIPIYDLQAAAGDFGEIQSEPNRNWLAMPRETQPSEDLFACYVIGESMNKVIPNGSICLFRKYTGGSRNGKIVLAELQDVQDVDFNSRYTVKEYRSKKVSTEQGWEHASIQLWPMSYDLNYKVLELGEDAINQVSVIGVFESILYKF